MMYPRQLIKRGVERALSSSALGQLGRRRIRGKRLILAYHGIIPEGESPAGERALFIPEREFVAQLDALVEFADVASIARIDAPGNGRPRVAITFDDAYQGAVTVGVRELVQRALPATFFVAPGRLGGHVLWWDALAENAAPAVSLRNHALYALAGSEERVRAWVAARDLPFAKTLPRYARTATIAELVHAVGFAGITVGSHTWSHANLASLGADEVSAELTGSLEWLRRKFGEKAISWVAYPYGLDSPRVHREAARAMYEGGLRISGSWHSAANTSSYSTPRLNIPAGLSLAGFRARLFGMLPA